MERGYPGSVECLRKLKEIVMTVAELIAELNKIEDQSKEVKSYTPESGDFDNCIDEVREELHEVHIY